MKDFLKRLHLYMIGFTMDSSTVGLVRCDTYDKEAVFEAVTRGIDLLGGIEQFVSKERGACHELRS